MIINRLKNPGEEEFEIRWVTPKTDSQPPLGVASKLRIKMSASPPSVGMGGQSGDRGAECAERRVITVFWG